MSHSLNNESLFKAAEGTLGFFDMQQRLHERGFVHVFVHLFMFMYLLQGYAMLQGYTAWRFDADIHI